MATSTISRAMGLLGLALVLSLVVPTPVQAGRVSGAWLVMVTIPPNPLLGNPTDIVIPETASFNARGAYVAASSLPAIPIPMAGGGVSPAILSPGQATWKRTAGGVNATNWRLLSDPETGQFLGFAKIYVELQSSGQDAMSGEYVLELLNPDLTPMELSGEPVVVGPSPVELTRLPIEPLPR